MFMPDCVDADFLDHCPRLRSIAGALRGFDNFDLSTCDARGIRYQFIPNLLAAPTAELTVAMLISLARSIPAGDAFMRTGQFPWMAAQFLLQRSDQQHRWHRGNGSTRPRVR